ncbi:unnamed protein product [Citrullus colocynthis]|uniref:Uncharacterized protein n=1 Tax=Citrullus colocynthis TaxID=252529 RepID=A0ABP0XZX0_9ROSI
MHFFLLLMNCFRGFKFASLIRFLRAIFSSIFSGTHPSSIKLASVKMSRLRQEVGRCGEVLGHLLPKLAVALFADVNSDYELLVKQLKEELREEKLKAKEEAKDLAQEMAELRYQMLEEECNRWACMNFPVIGTGYKRTKQIISCCKVHAGNIVVGVPIKS